MLDVSLDFAISSHHTAQIFVHINFFNVETFCSYNFFKYILLKNVFIQKKKKNSV